jgi:hypothetical protein
MFFVLCLTIQIRLFAPYRIIVGVTRLSLHAFPLLGAAAPQGPLVGAGEISPL